MTAEPSPAGHKASWEDKAKSFGAMKDIVLERRPILREIMAKCGTMSLMDYAVKYFDVNTNPVLELRKEELLSVVSEHLARDFDPATVQGVLDQLREYYVVSTSDHHGPVTHSFFLNSNLIMATAGSRLPHPIRYAIAFSTSNIYMNNSSLPRGTIMHSVNEAGHLTEHRFNFFSKQSRTSVVWNYPPYVAQDVQDILDELKKENQKGCIDDATYERASALFREVYLESDALASPTYTGQVSRSNLLLWDRYFTSSRMPSPAPRLIYLEQKAVVADLLRRHHLTESTELHEILFNPQFSFYLRNYFHGLQGTFTDTGDRGTYLFWAFPEGDSKRHPLRLEDGKRLVTEDGTWSVDLAPEAIGRALEEHKLVPGLLLSYITLAMYYGLKCLGGFNQVNTLTQAKNGYIKMCADLGRYKSIEACARVQTKEIGDGLMIAFLSSPDGQTVPAMGLDLALYGGEDTWGNLVKMMETTTVEESIAPQMPDIYRTSLSIDGRDPELEELTNDDIINLIGLKKRIVPCVTLSK